jgi:hypothetical protein
MRQICSVTQYATAALYWVFSYESQEIVLNFCFCSVRHYVFDSADLKKLQIILIIASIVNYHLSGVQYFETFKRPAGSLLL